MRGRKALHPYEYGKTTLGGKRGKGEKGKDRNQQKRMCWAPVKGGGRGKEKLGGHKKKPSSN